MFGHPESNSKDTDPPVDRDYRPMRGYFNWTRAVAKEPALTSDTTETDQDDSTDDSEVGTKDLPATKAYEEPKEIMQLSRPRTLPKPPASTSAAPYERIQPADAPISSKRESIAFEEPMPKRQVLEPSPNKDLKDRKDKTIERPQSKESFVGTKILGLTQKMDILNNKDFQYNGTTKTGVGITLGAGNENESLKISALSNISSAGPQFDLKKPSQQSRRGAFGHLEQDYNKTIDFQVGETVYSNIPALPVTGHVLNQPGPTQLHKKSAIQPQEAPLQIQATIPQSETYAQPYRIPIVSLTKQNVMYTTPHQPTMAGESRAMIAAPNTRQNSNGSTGSSSASYADDPEYKKALMFLDKNRNPLAMLLKKLPVQMLYINKNGYFAFEKIGVGGYGVVYKALQPNGQLCAIKLMSTQKGTSDYNKTEEETNYQAMIDEIEIMKQLKGKGICLDLLDYEIVVKQTGSLRRIALIAMELGDTDLRSFMKSFRSYKDDRVVGPHHPHNLLPESKILSLLYDMITVLHGMHKQGYIHCDLKPQNFMFHCGRLKLIDFGISKAMQQNTTCALTDTVAGTPKYMAPEIMPTLVDPTENKKTELHRVADVWSIGCILFEMAAGYHPLDRYVDKHILTLLKIVAEKKYVIEADDLHVSPELRDLIVACLEHSPSKRITMEEIFSHACLKSQFSRDTAPEFQNPSIS